MPQPIPPENRIRIDKTINIGTILSLLIFLGSLMAAWSAGVTAWGVVDKRVSSLEESRVAQRERDLVQDSVGRERMLDLRESIKELRTGVDKIADKVGAR